MTSMYAAVAVLMTVLSFLICVIGIVMYVFQAIGLYSISRRRNIRLSGFAWIPILNLFKLGQIADDAVLNKRGKKSHFMVTMPVFYIASGIIVFVGTALCALSMNLTSADIQIILEQGSEGFQSVLSSVSYAPEALTAGTIIFIVGYILMIVSTVMINVCYYHIYKSCTTSYIVMFVLSLIFNVVVPFLLFAVRKKDNPAYYKAGGSGAASV